MSASTPPRHDLGALGGWLRKDRRPPGCGASTWLPTSPACCQGSGEAWGPDVQALVVIRAGGKNHLYQNVSGKVALSPVDGPTVCAGVDSLGDYFAQSLFTDGMALKWAKKVAAHLVWNCKEYASGYCGGDTHLIEIPESGPVVFIDDQSLIAEYEQHLAPIADAMRIVLPSNSDPNSSDLTLEHRLKELTAAIARVRGLAVAEFKTDVGPLSLQGLPPAAVIAAQAQEDQEE